MRRGDGVRPPPPATFVRFDSHRICLVLCARSRPAYGWDSRTHELLTRLAIEAAPASPLKTSFENIEAQLQEYSWRWILYSVSCTARRQGAVITSTLNTLGPILSRI
jgi:hypothetical protein